MTFALTWGAEWLVAIAGVLLLFAVAVVDLKPKRRK